MFCVKPGKWSNIHCNASGRIDVLIRIRREAMCSAKLGNRTRFSAELGSVEISSA